MRRERFLDFLVTRYAGLRGGGALGDGSARSYCANLARAEDALGINFDSADLSASGLDQVVRRLRASALLPTKVSDCISAAQAYAQFLDGGAAAIPTRPAQSPAAASRPSIKPPGQSAPPRPDPLVAHMSVKGLLAMHGAVTDELLRRGVVRTSNSPGGDYAETLFSRAFGWTLSANSALGFDAVDGDGVRYQIKARRLAGNGSRQLGALRRLPERQFDHLAAVLFERDYTVHRAVILAHAEIERAAQFIAHTNAWRFMLEDRVWDLAGARDVTAELRSAAEGV